MIQFEKNLREVLTEISHPLIVFEHLSLYIHCI